MMRHLVRHPPAERRDGFHVGECIHGGHKALEFNTMTAEAKHIVDDFQALPDTTKREVLAELVRISARIDYPTVLDDELLSAANDVFLAYDHRESE
ncbi:MAG: hypothetical protein ACJ74H_14010 [Thermoanaerobaculia bacterium]